MPVHRQPKPLRFTPRNPVEMHYHDHDETWVIMGGKARAHMIGRDGVREDFDLQAGDIWMVEAGVLHGCETDDEVLIFPLCGSLPEGSHKPGHYYPQKERYLPTLVLRKDPLPAGMLEPEAQA